MHRTIPRLTHLGGGVGRWVTFLKKSQLVTLEKNQLVTTLPGGGGLQNQGQSKTPIKMFQKISGAYDALFLPTPGPWERGWVSFSKKKTTMSLPSRPFPCKKNYGRLRRNPLIWEVGRVGTGLSLGMPPRHYPIWPKSGPS